MSERAAKAEGQAQPIPVRMYQSDDRLMIAAPLPGMEPEDIHVTLKGRTLTIHVNEPGPRQEQRDLLLEEWRIGPFHRELEIPQAVDGHRANVTYGNGVLVLALPKQAGNSSGGPSDSTEQIGLTVVGQARGQHAGHAGQQMKETTTEEHQRELAEHAREANKQEA